MLGTQFQRTAKYMLCKFPLAATSEGTSFEAQIEPYKSDNAKLVKENNELHQQLIRTKEELDATSKGR